MNINPQLSGLALATAEAYFKVEGMKKEVKVEITPQDVLDNLDLHDANAEVQRVQTELKYRLLSLIVDQEGFDPATLSDEDFNQIMSAIINEPSNGLKVEEVAVEEKEELKEELKEAIEEELKKESQPVQIN